MRSKAIIYGRNPSKKITFYQKQINNAAIELAVADPGLLQNRKNLLELARSKVNTGYKLKKGKSHSKLLDNAPKPPKHQKRTDSMRIKHIRDVEDDLRDLSDRLQYKEKRRIQAEICRNYKVCDDLTEEMTALKRQKREKKN